MARKYERAAVTRALHHALLQPSVVSKHPLSIQALGCTYGLHDVARTAARHSLRTPIHFEYVDELELITLCAFHNLSDYRRRCSVAARRVTSYNGTLSWPAFKCLQLCRNHVKVGARIDDAWEAYLRKLDRIFEFAPDPERVRDAALVDPVIKIVKGPEECAQRNRTTLNEVATFFFRGCGMRCSRSMLWRRSYPSQSCELIAMLI